MNSSGGYPPSYGVEGVSGSMKAFFILVLLFLVFLFSASAGLGQVDLTPDTPAASIQSAPVTSADVISIQDNSALDQPVVTGETQFQVPVTGTCTDPYTIRSGDSLSQIAVLCDTSMASIRQANPQITNANMIYPGQQIRIPRAGAAPLPVTGNDLPQAAPTQAAGEQPVNPSIQISGQAPVIRTGTGVQVKALSFPANTPLNIAIGPQNQGYNIVASGITDANGNFTTRVTVPTAPDAQTPWVVVVATTGNPPIQAMSQPFYIGPAVP